MYGRLVVGISAVAALCTAGTAVAGAVERVRVAEAGTPETQGFPPTVHVTLESPPDYSRHAGGVWVGPPYWPAGRPEQRGTATMEWSVAFRDRTLDVARTAAAATTNGWPDDQRNGISVPLLVGRRQVGTLPGFFVLTAAPGADRARFEAALAVPLATGLQAVVRLLVREPSSDASPWGDYLVMGSFLASTWNRGAALIALSSVRVEGNLPPKVISIRRERGRRAVRGKVVDPFVNPLVRVPVALERAAGGGWTRVRRGTTTRAGTYLIAVPRPGRYRTSVALGGVTVRSGVISVR